jgi:hypothetical protein
MEVAEAVAIETVDVAVVAVATLPPLLSGPLLLHVGHHGVVPGMHPRRVQPGQAFLGHALLLCRLMPIRRITRPL